MAFTQIHISPVANERHTANGWIEGRKISGAAKPHAQGLSSRIGCSHRSQTFACVETKSIA